MWKYVPGTYVSGEGGGLTVDPYLNFWMNITQGDIDFKYFWDSGTAPQGGSYVIGLSDLVLLANAYGTSGIPPVPFQLGGLHVWEPGCDLAPPASVVGLSDLVTLAVNYGKHWGWNLYSYNIISTSLSRVEIGARDQSTPQPISESLSQNGVFTPTGFNTEHTFVGVPAGTHWWSVPIHPLGNLTATFDHWDLWMEDAITIHVEAVYK
jgi:hypothetical protein